MCVPQFQFLEKTFTLWLKKLSSLGRNEANPYLNYLKKKKKENYVCNLKMAELCYKVKIRKGVMEWNP